MCGTRYESLSDKSDVSIPAEGVAGERPVISSFFRGREESSALRTCVKCGSVVAGEFCSRCGTGYVATHKKCAECGAVVTGKFYSECGAQYGEKSVCAGCGMAFVGYFCPYCGVKNTARVKGRRMYLCLKYLIPTLFLLFATLLILACTAMPRIMYHGNTQHRETAYTMFDKDDWMMALSLICVCVACLMAVYGYFWGRAKVGIITFCQMMCIVALIFMASTLVSAAVICDKINGEFYQTGIYSWSSCSPAAGPICAVASGAIFMVATVVLLALTVSLAKKNRAFTDAMEEDSEKFGRPRRQSIPDEE